MKKTRYFIIIIVLILMSYTIQAQVTFGLRAGLNLSKQQIKNDEHHFSDEHNYKQLKGAHLGFILDFKIKNSYSLESGFLFNTKGYRSINRIGYVTTEEHIYLFCIDIPINLKYTLQLKNNKVFVTTGPYISKLLFGKGIGESAGSINETYSIDMKIGNSSTDDYRKYDFGWSFGAGIELGTFVFSVNYGLGIRNLSPDKENNLSIRNRVFSLSVGGNFGKCK